MRTVVPPFSIDPEPGEEIYLHKEFRGSHGHTFAMAVSSHAVYVSAQKLALRNDGWFLQRVPLHEVRDIALVRQRSGYTYALAGLMAVGGTLLSTLMMWRALNPMPGQVYHVSGWPFAIAVGGLLLPVVAKGRRTLLVRFNRGKLKWTPQLSVDKKTRETCNAIQDELLSACRRAGLATSES
jgi:hypothetical protein